MFLQIEETAEGMERNFNGLRLKAVNRMYFITIRRQLLREFMPRCLQIISLTIEIKNATRTTFFVFSLFS